MKQPRRTVIKTIGAGSIGLGTIGTAAATTTITIDGGGDDIWGDTDAFHYFYEEVDGDFDVTVKIDELENTDGWAKAGLMVRQSLAADEEHAMVRKTPGNDTSVQWRSDGGDEAESTTSDGGEDLRRVPGGTMTAEWQRLVRQGETIRAYGSNDGENWTLIAELSPSNGTVDFAGSAYVGLAVTSRNEGTLCTAAFSNLSGLSPSSNDDIGDVAVSGSVSTTDGDTGGDDPAPVVSTGSASNVTASSASLGGAVDELGGADSAVVSFEYRPSGARSWTTTASQTLSSSGTFSYQVGDLSSDTTYEFRAVLETSDGDGDRGSINTVETAVNETDGVVVEGAGTDIWNESDEGHYYFTDVSGDFDAVVAVDGLEGTDPYAKAGLMVRETLDPEAKNVMIRRTSGHDTSVQWRPEPGGESTSLTSDAGRSERETSGGTIDADYQRLVRNGETLRAYASENGEDWTLVADLSSDAIDLAESGYLGLAVTSHNAGTLCAAEFSELTGVSPTHSRDIGDVEVAGSVSGDDGAPVDTNPVVATGSATDVSATTATLTGRLDSVGRASSATVTFGYRAVGAESWTTTDGRTLSGPGSVDIEITDLSRETDYEFRAVVEASDGDTDTGAVATFTTGESDTGPVVTTGEVSEIDATSATLNGHLERIGGQASTADVAFEVRPVADDDEDDAEWSRSSTETLEEPGEFRGNVRGLSSETDYEYRAVVEADDGDGDAGEIGTFTTGEAHNDGGAHYDYTDGFTTPAPWLEDEAVDVYRIQEATRRAVEGPFQASGPRVIVFETSGVIDLGGDRLEVTEDKCWIAGQTAPSPGITFINGMVAVGANDCVVQHIRSRIGPGSDGNIQGNDSFNTQDDTTNNVVDHVTASWGTDECMSVGYDTNRTTYTNNLIYEGLYDPYGDGSDHNYGTLVGNGADNVTLAGNVWAKCRSRMPRLKGDTRSVVANNLCYFFDEGGIADGSTETSFVGNAYLGTIAPDDNVLEGGDAYLEDNVTYDPSLDSDTDFATSNELSSPPLWPDGLETMSASEVEEHNLRYAGARPADRTANDERIVREIANRAGNDRLDSAYDYWIPTPDAVGGYPDLPENTHSLSVPDSGLREWLEGWALAVEEPGASPP
ncbi:hypothetical protein [Natrinema salaciae]|uniref:Fibronectin type-III domain-containing protein n=1 Tax=Natrinema salaciae TaxID=1186196 RepID=A0A1H9QC57_9EURY|nr:hypothetical protein [Natrinema salaciae]SER57413.1 hypothetical protein SAMN04489841_4140 [Natrinema salaciae]